MLKAPFLLFLSLWLFISAAQAEPACQYLAYDGFDYTAGTPLFQQPGGTGWERAWEVQGDKIDLPGYQSTGAGSLAYDRLTTHALYAIGGRDYLVAGRKLDLSSTGPLAPYLAGGAVAANGKTVWLSGLLRKDQNNDTPVWLSLHGDNTTVYVHNPRVNLGFFGTASKVGGTRFWSLQINDAVYPSSVPITLGQAVLLAVAVTFDSVGGHTVKFFVNPSDLGSDTPPTPALTKTVTGDLPFRSIGLYLGLAAGNGAVDEIRLADSWRCATPTADVPVNLPPTVNIAATTQDGGLPLTVTLDGSASRDAEGDVSGFEWSFGDGSPKVSGTKQVTHTYTHLGQLRPSLTVVDGTGQENTGYITITVRDANGTFPCQSSVNMLQRPSCGKADGKFQVSPAPGSTYTLTNAQNQVIQVGASDTYSNLPVGAYQLTVKGVGNCSDKYQLYMQEDRTSCAGWTPSSCDLDIGMNLDGVHYYSRERAFRDFMKSAGTWIPFNASGPTPWNSGVLAEMPVNEDGYPTQIPFPSSKGLQAVRGIISTDNHMPPGDYVLLYEGSGAIQMVMTTNVVTVPGRVKFTIQAGNVGNIWFNIMESKASDPIRNIRILKASEVDDSGAILNVATQGSFNANFLAKLRPFKVIRYLNWSGVNPAQTLNDWDRDRTRATRYTQSNPKGVAFEYMVELANLLGKDIWLTVPHTASDDYLVAMARFFRDRLDPKLTIYLEYSDEVWNFGFSQAHWVDQNGPGNLNYPRKYVERAVHMFRLWREVFGHDQQRVKRLFNVQAANPWYGRQVLAHAKPEDYDYISPDWYAYLGGACERNLAALGAAATTTDVLNCARDTYTSHLTGVRQNYLNASLFGKEVINYEGGQSITGFGQERSYQAAIYAAQIDPQIHPLYQQMINDLRVMGSKLAMGYQLAGQRVSKYGSWGHLEDVDQAGESFLGSAPKYQALIDNLPHCTAGSP